jgi:glucosylceramidase
MMKGLSIGVVLIFLVMSLISCAATEPAKGSDNSSSSLSVSSSGSASSGSSTSTGSSSSSSSSSVVVLIPYATNNINYNLTTAQIIETTADGAKLSNCDAVVFDTEELSNDVAVIIDPESKRQTIQGFGGSFTEASAYVLACLDSTKRQEVIDAYYGPTGADYTIARTHIGSCDFTVQGKYCYDSDATDTNLSNFSIANDLAGFAYTNDPDLINKNYDLVPMIQDALAKKPDLKILSTPWSAPPWMKANNLYTSGELKTEMFPVFANYILKYIDAYADNGIPIWGLTPENEPGGGPSWEVMTFPAGAVGSRNYIKILGGVLSTNHSDVKIYSWDHNMDSAFFWMNSQYGDAGAKSYITGAAVHWYASSTNVYTNDLVKIHNLDTSKEILHTEACIDGIKNQYADQWQNWGYWFGVNYTDWGWNGALHPKYAAVHRYARDIIEGLNNWYTGWIDWNIVLNKKGLPNWKNNQCAAPIMEIGRAHV